MTLMGSEHVVDRRDTFHPGGDQRDRKMLRFFSFNAVRLQVFSVTLVAVSVSSQTRAANAIDQSNATDALAEIVVTAEKRNSTVQETPISLTAITGGQLESKGISTLEELTENVPGISMRTAGPGQTEYEMRGLSSSGGSVATVGFYLDDTPLSASAVAANGRTVIDPELFDLNHVEVLRGPQGTLYGAGSMGGTIKLVSNPPQLGMLDGAASVAGSATDGGRANSRGNMMANIPIGEYAALRVTATEKYTSGWIDRVVTEPGEFPFPTNYGSCGFYFCTRGNVLNAPVQQTIKGSNLERFSSIRSALLVKPNENLSVTATLMYQRIAADGMNQYQSPPGPLSGYGGSNVYAIYQPYDIQEPYYDTFKLGSLSIGYTLPFAQLTSATSYWQRYVVQSQDSTEPLQNIFNLTQFIPTLYQEIDPTWQISEELRLTSTGTGALQWAAGIYSADLHSTIIGRQQTPAFATALGCAAGISGGSCPPGDSNNITNGGQAANPQGIIFNEDNPNVMKQSAVFGELSYKVTSDLKVNLGLRYFKFTIDNTASQCGVGTGTGNATCDVGAESGSGNNVLPKVNLSYTPTSDLNIFGTMSKGSRPGGVNQPIPLPSAAQLAANPGAYNCGPGSGPVYVTKEPSYYGPDAVWSYELGEKARFSDQRFTLNSDIYYVRWEDIQQIIPLTCGYYIDTNAGTAHAYGPEAEFSAHLTSDISLNIAGALTRADIYAPTPQSGIAPGTRILNVPKYTGNVSLDYDHFVSDQFKITAHIANSYVGPTDDVAYYRVTLPSHDIVDARVGIRMNSWTAYLIGTNLANERAQLTINNTVFAWQQSTITRVATNQPRTIGLEFQTTF